jgi:RND superfamily putative drug exporter
MAIGAILVVVAAVAAALTLLPAALSLLGDKVNFLSLPFVKRETPKDNEHGFWARTTKAVVSHPVLAVVGTVTLLVAAAAPVATIKFGSSGLRDYPGSLESVQAFRVLDSEFSAGRLGPAHLMFEGDVTSPAFQRDIDELRQRLGTDANIAEIRDVKTNEAGTIANMDVIINGDALGPDAQATVDRIRSDYVPAAFEGNDGSDVFVGGAAAQTKDYVDTMKTYFPLVVGFVLALSFVLLMMVFRSIVIPVKAIVMNLLSVGAAYGLIVLVFQHGVGADLFGFKQTDSISAFLPAFLFAVLFGLSMDYHVFLLSRVQERFQHTGDNTAAVSYGLRSTAHIITGAAAIMMVVFGGFAMGSMVEMQQVGFGLAVAVFIDATIVRSVLVPASMELLGERNWYLPSWLAWLPKINVEGGAHAEEQPRETRRAREFAPVAAGGDC